MIFYLLDFRLWIIRVQCWVASIHWWIWTIFTFPYLRFMAKNPYQTFRFFHWVGSWALTTWSLSSRKRLHNNAALCWLSCNVSSYYFAIHALGNELIIFFVCYELKSLVSLCGNSTSFPFWLPESFCFGSCETFHSIFEYLIQWRDWPKLVVNLIASYDNSESNKTYTDVTEISSIFLKYAFNNLMYFHYIRRLDMIAVLSCNDKKVKNKFYFSWNKVFHI